MEYNTHVHPAGRLSRARFRGRNRQFGDISTIIHNSTRTFHCQVVRPAFFSVRRPFFDPFRGVLQTFYLSPHSHPLAGCLRDRLNVFLQHELFSVINCVLLQVCHSFSRGFDPPRRMNLRKKAARFFFMERKKAPGAPCAGQPDSSDDSPHRRVDFSANGRGIAHSSIAHSAPPDMPLRSREYAYRRLSS